MDTAVVDAWIPFWSAVAAAAATLTGLVFVAVSINLKPILKQSWLVDRAAESMMQLMGALLLAVATLVPHQPLRALGAEVIVISGTLWLTQTIGQIRYLHRSADHPLTWRLWRVVQTQAASAPLLVSGILLASPDPSGLWWLAPGLVLSLVAGVFNAWVLLVEILR